MKKCFGGYNHQKCRNIVKMARINSIFGFSHVAKNIEGRLKICITYLVLSRIWLNLPKDNHHSFLDLLASDHHFGYRKIS